MTDGGEPVASRTGKADARKSEGERGEGWRRARDAKRSEWRRCVEMVFGPERVRDTGTQEV